MDKDLKAIVIDFAYTHPSMSTTEHIEEFMIAVCKQYARKKIDEVIGEDEPEQRHFLISALPSLDQRAQNDLRAEQRQRAEEILGDK